MEWLSKILALFSNDIFNIPGSFVEISNSIEQFPNR